MKRGEVWWMNFAPAVGGGIHEWRPAVIVSNDAANRHLNRVQVVPLTFQVGRVYPSEALVAFGGKQGKAMADQLTMVSKRRLVSRGGVLDEAEMEQVVLAIKVRLGLG